jgi:3-oxoacyl-[acyl-carrier protein] reductase
MITVNGTLEGRIALVTGAGRGIGRGIALELARAGARVGLIARTQHELDDACAEIRAEGGTAAACAADLGNIEQTRSTLERLTGNLGPVDLLINNARSDDPTRTPAAPPDPTTRWGTSSLVA